MSRYSNAHVRSRQAAAALKGPHYMAQRAPAYVDDFAIGDEVEVKKTGIRARIESKASWGDYKLEGITGYFSAGQLRKISS